MKIKLIKHSLIALVAMGTILLANVRAMATDLVGIFALLNDFYPVPHGRNLRPTPFMFFGLMPGMAGGGLSAPGKMMVDSQGNVWAGGRQRANFVNLETGGYGDTMAHST